MYKSPIEIIHDIQSGLVMQTEDGILKAICKVGINVDRNELIRALEYDRDQYAKGYADGKAEATQWIPCSETVDIPDHEIIACDKYGEMMFGYLAYEDDQWLCASDGCEMVDPIAWREKPEPYRGEGGK